MGLQLLGGKKPFLKKSIKKTNNEGTNPILFFTEKGPTQFFAGR
ncbi:MAG: hypothetical protein CM1200mP3_03910 [Chloroflexota bacterium]|nr:MAG: hypothetical protein CM1200mP3_03910 [Chloroflexota bacterium]